MHLTYHKDDEHTEADRPSLRLALEEVFQDWRADNHSALDAGLPGDVLDLRLRLNAASANALMSE